MKRILLLLTVLFLIVISPVLSSAAETAQQSKTADPAQQKEEYEKSMEERLRILGKQLDELKAKAAARTEEARKDLNRYIKDADKKEEAASRKLEETRKASVKMWKKFVSDMDAAADDFETAYKRAEQRFKE
jgi:biopolymer transport protein ExbB/TolQ